MMSVIGELDLLRPRKLRPNAFEAVYAEAWGYDQRLAVERATLRVGLSDIDAVAVGIERPDVAERQRTGPRQSPFARTSGLLFAGVVGPLEPGRHSVQLELELAGGTRITAITDEVVVAARREPAPVVVPDVDVAIVMATHDPPADLFERQVESIRAQDHASWCCLVCDDASSADHLEAMRATLGDDDRFVLIENEQRVGFYLNFERGLHQVPPGIRFVALADQDDVWHPAKLRRQVAVLNADLMTQLVASDVRVVDVSQRMIAPTFYARRVPTHAHRYSLFVVNSLIGASMVFRRELLDLALPFPRAFPNRFHDHWLARSALVAGQIGFVGEPLHDYVQHGGNVFGSRHSVQWPLGPAMKVILRRSMGGGAELPREWLDHFVETPLEASVAARVLSARRPGESPPPWLERVTALGDGQLRELSRIVIDHARERWARRSRRESVEFVQFTGRSWMLAHRPREVSA